MLRSTDWIERVVGKVRGNIGHIYIGEDRNRGSNAQAGEKRLQCGRVVGYRLGSQEREVRHEQQVRQAGIHHVSDGVGSASFEIDVIGAVEMAQPAHVIPGQPGMKPAIKGLVGQRKFGRRQRAVPGRSVGMWIHQKLDGVTEIIRGADLLDTVGKQGAVDIARRFPRHRIEIALHHSEIKLRAGQRGRQNPGANTPCPALRINQPQPLDEQLHDRGLQIVKVQGCGRVIDAAGFERKLVEVRIGSIGQVVENRHRGIHRRHPFRAEIVEEALVAGII